MGSQGVKLAGIGGYILSDKGAKLFSFSGPTIASNALEAEYNAIKYILQVIHLSNFRDLVITVCSDSCTAIDQVKLEMVSEMKELGNFNLKHVPRKYMDTADRLAREGAKRSSLKSSWL